MCAGAGGARASDYGKVYAEGLKHSRRAASLAGANNCRAAVPEYTKAIKMLKDPVLLFNRAECYRALGDRPAAVADYRKFLVELPQAPNRAQVEAQIAALEPASTGTAAAAPPTRPSPVATSVPGASAATVSEPAPAKMTIAEMLDDKGDASKPPAAAPPAAVEVVTSVVPPPPPDVVHIDDPATMPLAADTEPANHSTITRRWWFWSGLAAVLVGGGAATYFALRARKTDIPNSDLGNYRF